MLSNSNLQTVDLHWNLQTHVTHTYSSTAYCTVHMNMCMLEGLYIHMHTPTHTGFTVIRGYLPLALMKSCCSSMMKTLQDISWITLTENTHILCARKDRNIYCISKALFFPGLCSLHLSVIHLLYRACVYLYGCTHILCVCLCLCHQVFMYTYKCSCLYALASCVCVRKCLGGVFWQQIPRAKCYSRSLLHHQRQKTSAEKNLFLWLQYHNVGRGEQEEDFRPNPWVPYCI